MKKYAVLLLMLLLTVSAGYAKEFEIEKMAGEYKVEVKIANDPPVVGKNKVEVEIKDKTGDYVKDARVRVDYSMPPMPGMPPGDYKAEATLEGEKYVAAMELTMAGSWNVTVKFKTTADKNINKITFSIDAR
ncbi:hypothetical protein MCHI_001483 [Candidatus Magnetoovum chiemensis]|nr:hypothetical protein MCHI_001483 [Candidatus Magnetoovum chiemensis]